MDPTISRTEQLNQLVRAFCVISLLIALEIAFLWGVWHDKPSVSIEAFIGVLTFALTWWFKSRDEQQRRSDMAPTTTTTTPGGNGSTVTKTGPTPTGT